MNKITISQAAAILGKIGGQSSRARLSKEHIANLTKASRARWSNWKERFFSRVKKVATNECWEWIGSKTRYGYGLMKVNGKPVMAHRLSFIIHNGDIPKGMNICHSCDNKGCVNPSHLWSGSDADNARDCSIKARHWNIRIPNAVISEIRNLAIAGQNNHELSKKFGIHRDYIKNIVYGRSRKHFRPMTSKDIEMMKRNRKLRCKRGTAIGNSKLTDNDVIAIKDRYARGETQTQIAESLNISQGTVHLITANKIWKHVAHPGLRR